jgi:hypothetical protein
MADQVKPFTGTIEWDPSIPAHERTALEPQARIAVAEWLSQFVVRGSPDQSLTFERVRVGGHRIGGGGWNLQFST